MTIDTYYCIEIKLYVTLVSDFVTYCLLKVLKEIGRLDEASGF